MPNSDLTCFGGFSSENFLTNFLWSNVPMGGAGGGGNYQICLECDFRLIWRQTKLCFGQSQSRGGGGGDRLFFFVTPPLRIFTHCLS